MRACLLSALLVFAASGCTLEEDDALGAGRSGLECIDTYAGEVCSDGGDPPPSDLGGCFVTGIGHIGDADMNPGAGKAKQDSFGGNAMSMKDGSVRGQWQNTTHLGDVFHGSADWLTCWNDGGPGPEVPKADPNIAEWGGTGKWNHKPGYVFAIHAEDRAEGGHYVDRYAITIYDFLGEVIYHEDAIISGGNFQIHPPNGGHPYETE